MKERVSEDENKKIAYDVLCYFKHVCQRENLKYYLAYGTLIGAVRHDGFIPWDDDIDVWMPRKDYDRLITLINNYNNDDFEFLHYTNNEKYYFPWLKICSKKTEIVPSRFMSGLIYGSSIDIFPLDEFYCNNENEAFEFIKMINNKYMNYYRKLKPYTNGIYFWKKPLKIIFKKIYFIFSKIFCINKAIFLNDLEKYIRKKENDNANYMACIFAFKPMYFEKKWFKEEVLKKFEDDFFVIPKDYDYILKRIYGEYMKLPPKEQQVIQHTYDAYYKNR